MWWAIAHPTKFVERSNDARTPKKIWFRACYFVLEKRNMSLLSETILPVNLGEIDIIAMQGEVLHFIEVKSGKADFDPIYNVTPAKLRKVINSAQYSAKSKNLDISFSIDALIIRGDEVEFIENVTL